MVGELARETGLSLEVLGKRYGTHRKPVTVRWICDGAARLLRLDSTRLTSYIFGTDEAEMKERLEWLQTCRKCSHCRMLFAPQDFILRGSLCKRCARVAKTPAIGRWEAAVEAKISDAPAWLHDAWEQAKHSMGAITWTMLSDISGRPLQEVRAAWEAAGLPDRPARPRVHKRGAVLALLLGLSLLKQEAQAGSGTSDNIHYRQFCY